MSAGLFFLTLLVPHVSVVWTAFFIPFWIFGVRLHHIVERRKVANVFNNIGDNAVMSQNKQTPLGFFYTTNCIGVVLGSRGSQGNLCHEIYMLCSDDTCESLIGGDATSDEDNNATPLDKITIAELPGNYWCDVLSFYKILYICPDPTDGQCEILDQMTEWLDGCRYHNGVFFISGKTGSGKSSVAKMLAYINDGIICNTFDPTRPGMSLSQLMAQMPSGKKVVLVIEEVDVYLSKIANGQIAPHKSMSGIRDKSGWNTLVDSFKNYENLTVIMTSNRTRTDIIDNVLSGDESYINKHRVNQFFELN